MWSISGSYESSLRLIRRFQYFVQVQLNTDMNQDDCRSLSKTSGVAGGIYQLKQQGLKKMVRALQLIYENKTDRDQELDVKLVKLLKVG